MNNQKIEAGFGSFSGRVRPHNDVPSTRPARSSFAKLVLTGLLAVSLAAVPALSFAESTAGEVSKESGLGAAAAVSSLIYGPAKMLYATGGLIVGAFAWAFTAGDSEVAKKVFTRSLRGNYVVTPAHLLGQERLEFIGRDLETPTTSAAAVASAGPVMQPYDEAQTYATPTYESPNYQPQSQQPVYDSQTQNTAPAYSTQDAGW